MSTYSPKVSVLMTVYNAEKYLQLSINSILNQNYKNLELVVVDDCSTDNSKKVLKSLKNNKIKKFFLKKHIGRTPALNYGLKKTKGKYIAILDADDIAHVNRIYLQQKFLDQNKEANIVATYAKLIDEKGKIIKMYPAPKNEMILNKVITYDNVYPHSSVMYKKKLLKKIGNYPTKLKYAQDYGLILKFAMKSKLHMIPRALLSCRQLKTSMTQSRKYRFIIIKERINLLIFSLRNFKLEINQKLNIFARILYYTLKYSLTFTFQLFGIIK